MPGTKRTASGVIGGLFGLIGLSAIAGVLITATVTPAIAVSGIAAKSGIDMFDSLPSSLEIDKQMEPTILYYKNADSGEYQEMTRFYEQNSSPVSLDQIAPVMIDALLSSEDNRYFTHGGIDPQGTARALIGNITKTGFSGGSSISQQYVKNVLMQQCAYTASTREEEIDCWNEATNSDGAEGLQRKLQEMRYAISLEQKYSKEDILRGYLNIVAFGGINYGIDAAAKYYFGVPAAQLNLSQAATLAGMVQSPDAYRLDRPNSETNGVANGYKLTKDRQLSVLYLMHKDGKITDEEYTAATEAPIEPHITEVPVGCAAATGMEYFCKLVQDVMLSDAAFGDSVEERQRTINREGLKVYTTIDTRIQSQATATLADWTPNKIDGMEFGAASTNLEVGTGRILSVTQNTKFSEVKETIDANPGVYSSLVYAADKTYGDLSTGFPVGSTFKLFTLVDWLEKGHSLREVVNGRDRVGITGKRCANQSYTWPTKVGNFSKAPGYTGTPMKFTADSLNSGYAAMASQLELCDIADVVERMGVTNGSGEKIAMNDPYEILGPANVSPLAMAGAYSAVANNGVYCRPHAIDRVIDSEGKDRALPDAGCKTAISPNVAATAAYALAGVMNGGTGNQANPYDGSPVIGKTGSHESWQTWMVESSTKVTTAVWVGNSNGEGDLWDQYYNGTRLSDIRYGVAKYIQQNADAVYGGGSAFPEPDPKLNRQIFVDLPSVIGMRTDEAEQKLKEAGFEVTIAPAADGLEDAGLITAQDPGAGQTSAGTTVTITPSNGKGLKMPELKGRSFADAQTILQTAGITNLFASCKQKDGASGERVTDTDPSAGSSVKSSTKVTITYEAAKCKNS